MNRKTVERPRTLPPMNDRVPRGQLRLDIWYGPPAENSDAPSRWQWQTTDDREQREMGDVLDVHHCNTPLTTLEINRLQLWEGLIAFGTDELPRPAQPDAPCWRTTKDGESRALRIQMFID